MSSIQGAIATVLETRAQKRPVIRAFNDQWNLVDEHFRALEQALEAAASDSALGSEAAPLLAEFQAIAPLQKVESIRKMFAPVRTRFERGTINIGVSGQARVGKSTLLQTLSGLSDDQIPTAASGTPVTAVRSRIFHSTENNARLTFHSFDSFREEVLRPYFESLEIGPPPRSADEFERLTFPDRDFTADNTRAELYRRLKDYQAHFGQYRHHLTGDERVLPLEGLRNYVAYPTIEEETAGIYGLHLAVRDAQIHCTFPFADVHKLCLIDLPGLGEILPTAESRHVAGLEDNVDLVVLVKRPDSSQASNWGDKDANGANIVSKARGRVKKASDFLFVVCNQSSNDPEALRTSLKHALGKMNQARSQDPYTILTGNARDRADVGEHILSPILEHLANSLGRMDQEVLQGCLDAISGPRNELLGMLNTFNESLRRMNSEAPAVILLLKNRSEELVRNVTVDLQSLLNDLEGRVRDEAEDNTFVERVDTAHNKILDELENGFEESLLLWESRLFSDLQVNKGWQGVAESEFNRLRVEISSRYCQLDDYLTTEVHKLQDEVAGILVKHFGNLLANKTGRTALDDLLFHAENAETPAEVFKMALQDFLGLKIAYRSHLHPRVRKELNSLSLTMIDSETGQETSTIFIHGLTRESAQQLREELQNFSQAASFNTRKALIAEARLPYLIFFAALEQFLDTLIRHRDSENNFLLMASSYRDDIWPNVFSDMKMQSVKMNALRKSISETRNALNETNQFSL